MWLYDVPEIGLRPIASYPTAAKEAYWLDVSPSGGRIAVPLENGDIQIFAPPREPTWEGLLSRAKRVANGRLTPSEKRYLNLDE